MSDELSPVNPYRYSDKRHDTGSDQLDMGARRYGPEVGQFLQEDTFKEALGELGLATDPLTQNRYALAAGNPVSFIETDGHAPIPVNAEDARKISKRMGRAGTQMMKRNAAPTPPRHDSQTGGTAPQANEPAPARMRGETGRTGPQSRGQGNGSGGVVHALLDVAGTVPVLGEPADLTNCGLYAHEGDKTNAALSCGAAIPGLGWLATGAKTGKRVDDVTSGANAAKAGARSVDELAAGARSRADELQAALPEGARGRVTMGVGVGRDAEGNLRTVIGTSEPKGYLRPGVSLKPGEELARGFGHAEDDIVSYMVRNGIDPVSVAAGRPICRRCGRMIGGSGGSMGSPFR